MPEKNQPKRSLILAHWVIALLIFFLFVSSWWMLSLPLPSEVSHFRVLPFQLHKNIGITVFTLLLFMLIVARMVKSATSKLTALQKKFARLDHIALYCLIVLCCISGYLSSSYSGWSTSLWWLIDLPQWAEENDQLNILFSDIHIVSCWALLLVMLLHIAAALGHAFNRDGAIDRMFKW